MFKASNLGISLPFQSRVFGFSMYRYFTNVNTLFQAKRANPSTKVIVSFIAYTQLQPRATERQDIVGLLWFIEYLPHGVQDGHVPVMGRLTGMDTLVMSVTGITMVLVFFPFNWKRRICKDFMTNNY